MHKKKRKSNHCAYSCEAECVSPFRERGEPLKKSNQRIHKLWRVELAKEAHGEGHSPQEPAMDYKKKGELYKKKVYEKKKSTAQLRTSFAAENQTKMQLKATKIEL